MIRTSTVSAVAVLTIALLGGPGPGAAQAQAAAAPTAPQPRPRVKGRQHRLKIDSSPQQAAVYWDAGATPAPKTYGIAGYTPLTIKVPRGPVKIVVELAGFKPQEQTLDVRKSQTVSFTLERAPQMAHLDIAASAESGAAGAEVFIDGVSAGRRRIRSSWRPAGTRIELRKEGYKPFSDWLEVAEGERRTRDVALTKVEAPVGHGAGDVGPGR